MSSFKSGAIFIWTRKCTTFNSSSNIIAISAPNSYNSLYLLIAPSASSSKIISIKLNIFYLSANPSMLITTCESIFSFGLVIAWSNRLRPSLTDPSADLTINEIASKSITHHCWGVKYVGFLANR